MLKKLKNKIKRGYGKFIKTGGIYGYLRRSKYIKVICVIIGVLLWYHIKTTPDMNIIEEMVCYMLKIANLAAFIFLKDEDVYKGFFGEP